MRTIKALTLLIVASLVLVVAGTAGAQTPPSGRDTSHVALVRPSLDSFRLFVKPALDRYCATAKPVTYVCAVRPLVARLSVRLTAAESALVVAAFIPPPPPPPVVPAGLDTTPHSGIVNGVELPRVYLATRSTDTPSNGRTLTVVNGGNLQAALDTACWGDRVVMAAGATYSTNHTVPNRTCGTAGAWITVTTSGGCTPEGTRMTPAAAASPGGGSPALPKIVGQSTGPALQFAASAARWRFQCLDIGMSSGTNVAYTIVNVGMGDETTVGAMPTDIIFDRVYVHGHTTLDARRAITANASRVAVVDSYLSEIHSTFDSNGFATWQGAGPFKIVNNTIETSGVGIGSGGATVSIPNAIPSDMEIRRNYITKNLAWRGTWVVKNLLELKSAVRVLIDGNVMENSVPDAQQGFAFVLWSVNQPGSNCSWCTTSDVTITNNIVRNTAAGFALAGKYYGTSAPLMRRLNIRNNVFIGVANPSIGGFGRLFQIADGAIADLAIEHNTMFTPNGSTWIFGPDVGYPNLVIRNNLTGGGQYQLSAGAGIGTVAWNSVAGPGSAFLGNVVALTVGTYPTGNFYPETLDAIGLVGGASAAYSVTASPSDLALSAASPYKSKATDGSDPGANMPRVLAATAGVKP